MAGAPGFAGVYEVVEGVAVIEAEWSPSVVTVATGGALEVCGVMPLALAALMGLCV